MATTITTYYASQDVDDDREPLSTWSVYAEEWEPEALAAGEPIDGSQRWVSTHESEDAAHVEASRLFEGLDPIYDGTPACDVCGREDRPLSAPRGRGMMNLDDILGGIVFFCIGASFMVALLWVGGVI